MDEISWNSVEGSFQGIILKVHANLFLLPATAAEKLIINSVFSIQNQLVPQQMHHIFMTGCVDPPDKNHSTFPGICRNFWDVYLETYLLENYILVNKMMDYVNLTIIFFFTEITPQILIYFWRTIKGRNIWRFSDIQQIHSANIASLLLQVCDTTVCCHQRSHADTCSEGK